MPPQAAEYHDEDDAERDDAFHDDGDDDDDSVDRRTHGRSVATQKQTSQAASAWPSGKTHNNNISNTVSSDVICHFT